MIDGHTLFTFAVFFAHDDFFLIKLLCAECADLGNFSTTVCFLLLQSSGSGGVARAGILGASERRALIDRRTFQSNAKS